MATRVWEISVTVPAGTPRNAPLVTPWLTEDNYLNSIELEVPPGHNGLTGIRVMKGDVSLLPWSIGTFVVANDYTHEFVIGDYVPTADVSIQAFNTGQYSHTFYLRAVISDWDLTGGKTLASPSAALTVGTITASPDPLSPDAILGTDTAALLADGTLTANDLQSVTTENLTVPPAPVPAGL